MRNLERAAVNPVVHHDFSKHRLVWVEQEVEERVNKKKEKKKEK